MLQSLMHAGQSHEGGPACCEGPHPVHCWSCHRDGPKRAKVACGECWHAWRWGWMLSVHHLWCGLQMGPWMPGPWGIRAPWWRLDRWAVRIWYSLTRPSKIYVCPCCAHDL